MQKTIKLSFSIQKGGQAKTTTAATVGAILAEITGRVLLVDFDPQGSLTKLFGVDATRGTVADVMGDTEAGNKTFADVIVNIRPGLDLVPSSVALAETEAAILLRRRNENILNKALATVADRYSWIIIDNAPGLGLLLTNALIASDYVIAPVTLDSLSVDGLALFLQTVKEHKDDFGDDCADYMGTVITRADTRTALSRDTLADLQGRPELGIFQSVIPERVAVKEAALMNQVVTEYEPKNAAAEAYRQLVKEIIDHG